MILQAFQGQGWRAFKAFRTNPSRWFLRGMPSKRNEIEQFLKFLPSIAGRIPTFCQFFLSNRDKHSRRNAVWSLIQEYNRALRQHENHAPRLQLQPKQRRRPLVHGSKPSWGLNGGPVTRPSVASCNSLPCLRSRSVHASFLPASSGFDRFAEA